MIATEPIDHYLERLASREPTPGGGAAAALHAAQGAALIGMVARYTTGANFAQFSADVREIQASAQTERNSALKLADEDEAAFQGVIDAYRLPRGSTSEIDQRRQSIQRALQGAAAPPQELVAVAAAIVTLGERLVGIANPNVISDVAAAAEAARAAAATARINIEINLSSISDTDVQLPLHRSVVAAGEVIASADALSERVRKHIIA